MEKACNSGFECHPTSKDVGFHRSKPVTQMCGIKVDPSARDIINKLRGALIDRGELNPNTSDVIRELNTEAILSRKLCKKLLAFVGEHGENEGAVDVLDRLLHELTDLRVKTRLP